MIFIGGLLTSMLLIMLIVGMGVASIVLANPTASAIASVLALCYIVYLAFRIAAAPPIGSPHEEQSAPTFASGVLLNFVNPKAYAAVGALFSGFVLYPGQPTVDALLKAMIMTSVIIVGHIGWMITGTALAKLVTSPRLSRAINVTFALALILSVLLSLAL
jgi:threonine/homoserine/homoserine lactone efflux protein